MTQTALRGSNSAPTPYPPPMNVCGVRLPVRSFALFCYTMTLSPTSHYIFSLTSGKRFLMNVFSVQFCVDGNADLVRVDFGFSVEGVCRIEAPKYGVDKQHFGNVNLVPHLDQANPLLLMEHVHLFVIADEAETHTVDMKCAIGCRVSFCVCGKPLPKMTSKRLFLGWK